MSRFFCTLLVVLLGAGSVFAADRLYPTKEMRVFESLPAGAVEPQGWLRDWAVSAKDGYTGVMQDVHKEFQNAWRADFAPTCPVGDWPRGSWSFEGGGYWFDGLVRLAYALHDEKLIALAKERIQPVLDNANPKGIGYFYWFDRFNPKDCQAIRPDNGWGIWANGLYGRTIAAYYDASSDPKALQALCWGCDDVDANLIATRGVGFAPTNIINAYDCYTFSGNKKVQQTLDAVFAPDSWDTFHSWKYYRVPPTPQHWDGQRFIDNSWNYNYHGAVDNEILTNWIIGYLWTGKTEYRDTAAAWGRLLDEKGLQPYGALVEDEWLGRTGAYRSTETCALANELFRRIQFFKVLGNAQALDQIERLFFNAGAGMVSRDFTKHVYLQTPNRTHGGTCRTNYGGVSGLGVFQRWHGPLCCTAALNKVLPFYIQHQWMTTLDGGLAAVLYAPNKLTAKAGGATVVIDSQTEYPFGETITMKINPEKAAAFPLLLHIPGWCKNPTVALNGDPVAVQPDANGFVRIERTWAAGDAVVLNFPMKPAFEKGIDQNTTPKAMYWCEIEKDQWGAIPFGSVTYGPLLFAYPVAEKDENTPAENAPWQFALRPDFDASQIEVTRQSMPERWDWRVDAPIQLKIKAQAASWAFNPNVPLLPTPEQVETKGEQVITLVPYGCAKLRVSMFPFTK